MGYAVNQDILYFMSLIRSYCKCPAITFIYWRTAIGIYSSVTLHTGTYNIGYYEIFIFRNHERIRCRCRLFLFSGTVAVQHISTDILIPGHSSRNIHFICEYNGCARHTAFTPEKFHIAVRKFFHGRCVFSSHRIIYPAIRQIHLDAQRGYTAGISEIHRDRHRLSCCISRRICVVGCGQCFHSRLTYRKGIRRCCFVFFHTCAMTIQHLG